MINAAKELARTVGHKPLIGDNGLIADANQIVSGRFVKLADNAGETVVTPVLGTDAVATADILGIAADDTKRLPYNGMYEIIDNYYKHGTVAAFVLGGLFTVWNDGRGAVFADDVFGADVKPGAPLYVNADGVLSVTAGADDTKVAATVVGSILRGPKTADGTLFFKAKGL